MDMDLICLNYDLQWQSYWCCLKLTTPEGCDWPNKRQLQPGPSKIRQEEREAKDEQGPAKTTRKQPSQTSQKGWAPVWVKDEKIQPCIMQINSSWSCTQTWTWHHTQVFINNKNTHPTPNRNPPLSLEQTHTNSHHPPKKKTRTRTEKGQDKTYSQTQWKWWDLRQPMHSMDCLPFPFNLTPKHRSFFSFFDSEFCIFKQTC